MNLINYEENKILYTNDIWKWLLDFKSSNDYLVITPLTKFEDLFNLKANSPLKHEFDEIFSKLEKSILNEKNIDEIKNSVNGLFKEDVIQIEINQDKLLKMLFIINQSLEINNSILNSYLKFLDKWATKQLKIIITGFDVINHNFNMITVHNVINNFSGNVSWNNLEKVVLLDIDNGFEILDQEKFKSWLEFKTRTVLTNKDIDDYFSNSLSIQSYMIEKAIRKI